MWSWLSAELSDIAHRGDQARFALDLSDQKVSLIERTAAGPRLRDAAAHQSDDFELQLQRLRRRVAGSGSEAPVDLLLPPELTLTRVETFPAEARRNLRDEAYWRLDAMTPYRPEELCYDVALLDVEPKTGFLEVSVALTPKEIVEEALYYAERWGFAPQRVTTSAPAPGFKAGPLFHRAGDVRRDSSGLRLGVAALAAAALALTAIGVVRGVVAREAQLTEIVAEADQAETALAQALKRKDATLAFAERAMLPGLRRRERDLAADWLDALAEALPPETTIDRVLVVDDRIRLEGAAIDANAALAAAATIDAFRDARLAAPPAPLDGAPRRESFAIEATLSRVLDPSEMEEAMHGPPPPEPSVENLPPEGAEGAWIGPQAAGDEEAMAAR